MGHLPALAVAMLRSFLLALLLLLVPALVSAQALTPGEPSDRLLRLSTWLDAVEHHQPGKMDGALIVARAFSIHDVEELWRDVHGLLRMLGRTSVETFRAAGDTFRAVSTFAAPFPVAYSKEERESLRELANLVVERGGLDRLIKRGALLHADIALMHRAMPERAWAPSYGLVPGLIMDMADGGSRGVNQFAPHLEFGRTLLDFVRPTPSADSTVRLWYHATMAYLHGEEHLNLPHVFHAADLFPEDPDILLQAGCLHEWLASESVQSSVRSVKLPRGASLQVGAAGVELTRARRLFERASRANSNLAEARIRLGRVLHLQGEHREAVRELRRALESPADTLLRYYAQLFLGAAEDALRNVAEARVAYRAAATLYPRAQSAHLALARLARATGDDDEALQRVELVLRLPTDSERHDPWWMYHISAGRSAEALLSQLRQQVVSSERD